MKISELIEELQKIRAEHGDLDVEYTYNDYGTYLNGATPVTFVHLEQGTYHSEKKDKDISYQYVRLY